MHVLLLVAPVTLEYVPGLHQLHVWLVPAATTADHVPTTHLRQVVFAIAP